MNRRQFACGAFAVAAGVAGCVDDVVDSVPEEAVPEGGNGASGTDGPSPVETVETVETLLAALAEGDIETQERLIHEESSAQAQEQTPLDVHTVEERDVGAVDAVDEAALEAMHERLGVEDSALVYTEVSDQSTGRDEEQTFVLVSDGGTWYLYDTVRAIPPANGDDPPQDDAESTGEESTEQITTALQVISQVGVVEDDSLEAVRLMVGLRPGGDELDLAAVEIDFVPSSGPPMTLSHGETNADGIDTGTLGDGEFGIVPETADGPVLSDSGDRAVLVIDAYQLSPGDVAEAMLRTEAGAATETIIQIPEPLPPDGQDVRL